MLERCADKKAQRRRDQANYYTKPRKGRLDEVIKQASLCGISYGKYRAALNAGKTFEEIYKALKGANYNGH